MGGLNMQRFVGGNVGASSFARGAVTGRFSSHQTVQMEMALEQVGSENARDLADLLARVRGGQFTTNEALSNAEETIAALARRAQLFEEDAVVVVRLESALARRDVSNPFYNEELGMCLLPDQLFSEEPTVQGALAYLDAEVATAEAQRYFTWAALGGVSGGGGESIADDITKEDAGILLEEEVAHVQKIGERKWVLVPKNIPRTGEALYMMVYKIDSLPDRLSKANPSETEVVRKVMGQSVSQVYKGPKVSTAVQIGQTVVKEGNSIEWYVVTGNGDLFLIKIGEDSVALWKAPTGEAVPLSWRDFFGR